VATVKTVTYSMPRGDTRSLPVSVPIGTYSVGASIFFGMKTGIDADITDSSAVLKKTLTDANIQSTTATTVNYLLVLTPADTTNITPATYFAEFEFVSADKSVVISYPDPDVSIFKIKITGDVNRRTS
jgi:hypothetical protein